MCKQLENESLRVFPCVPHIGLNKKNTGEPVAMLNGRKLGISSDGSLVLLNSAPVGNSSNQIGIENIEDIVNFLRQNIFGQPVLSSIIIQASINQLNGIIDNLEVNKFVVDHLQKVVNIDADTMI
jgi:hypothetical protein